MRIYILRHGLTDWNERRLFQGQVDTDLNETGYEQARNCAETIKSLGLSFDAVYSSPLKRAFETVKTVTGLPEKNIIKDSRLKEMDFGILDSTPFEKDSPSVGTLFSKPSTYVPPKEAESFADIEERIASFFQDLIKTNPGESVLIGTHGAMMRGMLVHFGYLKLDDIWNQKIGNCAIIEAVLHEDGSADIVTIHETPDVY